jgi:hypothetical protein
MVMIGILVLSSMFGFAMMIACLVSGMPVANCLLIWPLVGTSTAGLLFAERALVPVPERDLSRQGPRD